MAAGLREARPVGALYLSRLHHVGTLPATPVRLSSITAQIRVNNERVAVVASTGPLWILRRSARAVRNNLPVSRPGESARLLGPLVSAPDQGSANSIYLRCMAGNYDRASPSCDVLVHPHIWGRSLV